MMTTKMKPIHPAEILKEELEDLGMSANALAQALGVPTNRITSIIGKEIIQGLEKIKAWKRDEVRLKTLEVDQIRCRGYTVPMNALLFVVVVAMPFTAVAADCKVVDPELQGFYEGSCRNGLAHGYGYARGTAEYQGEFRKGVKHGKGVKTWAWGDRYEGGFLDDRRHGKGMYVWGAGSPWAGERFVGDYAADQRESWGTYYWPNGDRFEGVWKEDRRYGYSAMEQRRQAATAARSEALQPGTQVCSWGRTGIAYKVLRVGKVESLEGNALQVRLVRLEGVPQAVSGSNLQPGMLLDTAPGDWIPCS